VLASLVERRRALKADHLMLLSTPTGRPVSATMLRDRYEAARERAGEKAQEAGQEAFAAAIRAMYLRDMRKRAADLSDAPSELLQHGDKRTTERHYLTRAAKLTPAR
jgi:hypothetical protein